MPRKKDDLEKHTLNFHRGDFDRLRALYPEQEIGQIVRTLIHQHIEAEEIRFPRVSVPINVPEKV